MPVTPDYSVTLSAADDTDISLGDLVYTVTLGTDATGFTADVEVNGSPVSPAIAGNTITISGLVSGDIVTVTVISADDISETDTASLYTVA